MALLASRLRVLCLCACPLALAGLWTATTRAQAPTPPQSLQQRYTAPIELFKTGLGTFSKPMSSSDKEAQAFFDQGFQMMYSFAKSEAVRSFRESWKRDPTARSAIGVRPGHGGRT